MLYCQTIGLKILLEYGALYVRSSGADDLFRIWLFSSSDIAWNIVELHETFTKMRGLWESKQNMYPTEFWSAVHVFIEMSGDSNESIMKPAAWREERNKSLMGKYFSEKSVLRTTTEIAYKYNIKVNWTSEVTNYSRRSNDSENSFLTEWCTI